MKPVGSTTTATTTSTSGVLPIGAQQAPGILAGQGLAHRSAQAAAHARNLEKNPHYATTTGTGTASNQDNFLYFYHPDHLGSSSYVTDAIGKVFEHIEYFPFGETWVEESSNTQRTPYLFTAKELDEETGLYYFGARYYDPRTSVWQSADPILGEYLLHKSKNSLYQSAVMGLYGYSHANPLTLIDPDGKEPNKAQAVTWTQARGIIVNHFKQTNSSPNLAGLAYTSGDATGKQVGPFGGASGGRYVWTKNRGWVDLAHFFQVAAKSQEKLGNPGALGAVLKGSGLYDMELTNMTGKVENAQRGVTRWSYEDPSSNQAGGDFYTGFFHGDSTLLSDLDKFFKDAGAGKPTEAPNWKSMQRKEDGQRRWFKPATSMEPVLNPERLNPPRVEK